MLKRETHLPVIVDPSHAAGRSDLVLPLARAAVAAGADGVMIEVHPQPEDALCDGPQQIPIGEFAESQADDPHARRAHGQDDRVAAGFRAVIERLAIVGAGLIGASVGLAAKARSAVECRAYDRDEEVLAVAAERGAVDVRQRRWRKPSWARSSLLTAVPVAQLVATVRAMLEAELRGMCGHGRRLDEGGRLRGGLTLVRAS